MSEGLHSLPDVELPCAAIRAHRSEEIFICGEADIIYFFIVRYELREDSFLLDVPDRASRIDRSSANQIRTLHVPIEGC